MRRHSLVLVVACAALLAVTGCGVGEADPEPPPLEEPVQPEPPEEPEEPPEEERELAQRCENAREGYAVRYPEDWHTNRGDGVPACSYFHPEPFQVPERQEFFDVAILAQREPVGFERIIGEDPATRIVERQELEVAGRAAVARVVEATGEGLMPEGTRGYQYLVDLERETLIVSTYDVGDLDFERNREVLDAMARTIELDEARG